MRAPLWAALASTTPCDAAKIDSMLVSYKPLAACSGAAYDKRDVSGLVLVSSYHWCVDALVPVASQDGCPHQRRRRSRAVRGSPSRHGSAPRPHDRASPRGGRPGPSTRTARRRRRGGAVARRKTARRAAIAAVPRPPPQSPPVWKSNLRRVRPESPRRPPRHRRGACSMAWRCRFLTARPSQHGRVIAEK